MRPTLRPSAPLLLCAALAACSSSGTPSVPAAGTAPAPAPATATAAPPSASASATSRAGSGATGAITVTGAVSGRMTLFSCPADGPGQLVVTIDGEDRTYTGVIDTDDFAFVGPGSAGWTLDEGAPRPTRSGTTWTVPKTTLVGVFDERKVSASGSVTCP